MCRQPMHLRSLFFQDASRNSIRLTVEAIVVIVKSQMDINRFISSCKLVLLSNSSFLSICSRHKFVHTMANNDRDRCAAVASMCGCHGHPDRGPSTKADDELTVHEAYAAWIREIWKPGAPYVAKPPTPQAMQAQVSDPRKHKQNVFKSSFVTNISARFVVANVLNFAAGRGRSST